MLFEATDEQNISHRAQFLAAYRQFVERAQADAKLLPAVREVRANFKLRTPALLRWYRM